MGRIFGKLRFRLLGRAWVMGGKGNKSWSYRKSRSYRSYRTRKIYKKMKELGYDEFRCVRKGRYGRNR